MDHKIKLVRVYELDDSVKGSRILVDKVWPRGVPKERLEPFYWAKEITPTTKLRKWFGHKEERFDEFKEKYLEELDSKDEGDEFVKKVADLLKKEDVVFLYGAKDKKINHVVILKEWTEKKIKELDL